MIKGRVYTLKSNAMEVDFIYGRTLKNKVLNDTGTFICDLNSLPKQKAKIDAKK